MSEFGDWLLVERDLTPGYAALSERRLSALGVCGLAEAEAAVVARSKLAAWKRAGRVNMVRSCQKALNLWAEFQGWEVRWELVAEPRRRFDPYDPAELELVAASVRGDSFSAKRLRAVVWLLANAEFRRGELHRLAVEDLDGRRSAVRVWKPEKGGVPEYAILPRYGFRSGMPVPRYLAARSRVAGRGGPLWVTMQGRPMSESGFANLVFVDLARCGVKVNFNRFRHTRGTIYAEAGTSLATVQRNFRHRDPKNTMWYVHNSLEQRRAVMIQSGVPGYEGEAPEIEVARWGRVGLASP